MGHGRLARRSCGEFATRRSRVDILVANAGVLLAGATLEPLLGQSVAIIGARIVDIGPAGLLENRYIARRRIDASRHVVLPGLVNGHTHLFQVFCRGLGDGHDLTTWADHAVWPLAPYLDASIMRLAAHLACIELIETGTTTVVDSHYLHSASGAADAIAQGCWEAGVRAILCRAAMDSGPVPARFRESVNQALEATERFMERWHGKGGRLSVRPEALNEVTASRELILGLRALSRQAGTGFHMHAAETRSRVEALKRTKGLPTIAYLNHLGVLGPDVVLAHCVWVEEEEQAMLGDTGTGVVHNPVSNQFLADGIAPLPALLKRGVRVALGTDGAASNDTLNMFEVMKTTVLLHRVANLRADVLAAREVLMLATIGGARALGIDKVTGALEVGRRADLLLVRLDTPGCIPWHAVLPNLVYGGAGRGIDVVIIDGRIVAEGGRCVSLDRKEVLREAETVGKWLRRATPLTTLPTQP